MRMQIFLLTVGGAFLVLCIQFFRGKWLRLLAGNTLGDISPVVAAKAGKHVALIMLIFGLALILLAFSDSRTDMLSLILFSVGTIYTISLVILTYYFWLKS